MFMYTGTYLYTCTCTCMFVYECDPQRGGLLDFWIWKGVVSWMVTRIHITGCTFCTHTHPHTHTPTHHSGGVSRQAEAATGSPGGCLHHGAFWQGTYMYMYVYMLHSLTHITHNVPISHVHKLTYHTFSHYTLTYHELLYHKFTYQLPIHHFKHISG